MGTTSELAHHPTDDKDNFLPLDWTKLGEPSRPVRFPCDVVEYQKDDVELFVVGTAGKKITYMGKDLLRTCPNVKSLVLRSHLIIDIEGLDLEENQLELLELYDNQVQALNNLEFVGPNLRVLDMRLVMYISATF